MIAALLDQYRPGIVAPVSRVFADSRLAEAVVADLAADLEAALEAAVEEYRKDEAKAAKKAAERFIARLEEPQGVRTILRAAEHVADAKRTRKPRVASPSTAATNSPLIAEVAVAQEPEVVAAPVVEAAPVLLAEVAEVVAPVVTEQPKKSGWLGLGASR
ncbi:hypothetical protein SAMN05444156_2330 [Verrucomicrobium sp. GAS474]|uniref:hypothetical protein n=1 Tax=Verrucomicrobium sp. GAS474 TaxID=1882831 RepID=UPI00087B3C94|nr:hypothetical protein [Verrucomicrobium sp. GAS474]SDU16100.1 hypothetical protein SAMN05444156_2330 [Verrucomicrobium sp. GAS474]